MVLLPQAGVFPPLESDPVLFSTLLHKLGSSPSVHYEDVFSLDEPPNNVLALVLISSSDRNYEEALAQEEHTRIASLSDEQKAACDSVIWLKQTLHNACGCYALLHGICNLTDCITPGSFLDAVLKAGSREERQSLLETSQELRDAYLGVALQGQTAMSEDWAVEPPFHYISFVRTGGRVWELNGGRLGPVDRGMGRSVLEVVKERIGQEDGGTHSLMALVKGVE